MIRLAKYLTLSVLALPICPADFQNGQAARAVIGQSSFSSQDAGITATAVSTSNGRLYVADTRRRLLAFDLSQIAAAVEGPASRQDLGCAVCGFSPFAILNQSVIPGIAAASLSGKSVAVADTANHRVLVWLDATSETALKHADVILGNSTLQGSSLSASTLIDPISVALDGKRLYIGDAALHRVLIWNSLPQTDNQPADVVLGQANFTTSNVADVPAADTIGRPVALEADGTSLFVADSVSRRILVFTTADIPLAATALANSANLTPGPVAPGSLVTISASGLTQSSAASGDNGDQALPRKLNGVEVMLDGVPLPLQSVSPVEIRAQLPYDTLNRSSASLYIRSEPEDGSPLTSSAIAVSLLPASPGLFAFTGKEPRPAMTAHGEEGTPITSRDPAGPGETITVWGSGLGPLTSAGANASTTIHAGVPNTEADSPVQIPVIATVNGASADVLSATLPQGSIGIYEIRIVLPANLPASENAILSISQDGQQSNAVTVPVRKTIQ